MRLVNLCENIRGKFIFEMLSDYYEVYNGEESEDLNGESMEVYEIKCDCTRFFSDEPERIFCKSCWKFMEVKKVRKDFIYVGEHENEVYPIHIRGFLKGYFPYFGIKKKFENCIILLDDFYKMGEILKSSQNCKIYLIGKCLNCKEFDEKTKLILAFFTSPFVEIEIDPSLLRWAERTVSRIKNLEKKEKDGESLGILECFVKKMVDRAEFLIKRFEFFQAGKILLKEVLPFLEEVKRIPYSIKEYERSLRYYYNPLSRILGFRRKEVEIGFKEEAFKAYELIKKSIKDIEILMKKLENKKKAYIKPPEDYFEYFESFKEYISMKTGLDVVIVKELPKRKKTRDVGIYLD